MITLILKNASVNRGWSPAPNLTTAWEKVAAESTPLVNWIIHAPAKRTAIPTPVPPDKNSAKTSVANMIVLSVFAAQNIARLTVRQPDLMARPVPKTAAAICAIIPAKSIARPEPAPPTPVVVAAQPETDVETKHATILISPVVPLTVMKQDVPVEQPPVQTAAAEPGPVANLVQNLLRLQAQAAPLQALPETAVPAVAVVRDNAVWTVLLLNLWEKLLMPTNVPSLKVEAVILAAICVNLSERNKPPQ